MKKLNLTGTLEVLEKKIEEKSLTNFEVNADGDLVVSVFEGSADCWIEVAIISGCFNDYGARYYEVKYPNRECLGVETYEDFGEEDLTIAEELVLVLSGIYKTFENESDICRAFSDEICSAFHNMQEYAAFVTSES